MKEFLQRTVAALMVAVYSLSVAPASELALTYQAGRKTLDAYLERAEIQGDREKFEKIAEQGIGAAIAEWEQNSLELKISDYDEWLLQKDALQEDLQNYKDLSFEAWTLKKQTEEKAAMQKTALYNELRKAALEFSFKKADGTTTRIVSQEFIGEAKKQWNELADGIVQKHIDKWFSENDDAEFLRNEFLSLETSITNSLVNALLYDHASLKKLSDAEAAAVIAQQLADDIDAQTTDSMNRLFDSMQTQVESVDENAASGGNEKEWLSKFEKELEAGLAKWDEAERSFLNARVEWEQNAENIFLNDNQKWMEAYNELEKRKSQWVEKIEKQIEEGKKKWKAKFTNLQNEIEEYFQEFQQKFTLERQQKEQIVDAGISAYNQCRDILVMAQKGVSNWYARWCEKYNGLYSYWKTEIPFAIGNVTNLNQTTSENLKAEINLWKSFYINIVKEIFKKYEEELERQYQPVSETNSVPSSYEKEYNEHVKKQKTINSKYFSIRNLNKKLQNYNVFSPVELIAEMNKEISAERKEMETFFNKLYNEIDDSVWECFDSKGAAWKASDELFEWLDVYDKYLDVSKDSLSKIYSLTGSGFENSDFTEIENEKTKLSALVSYWENRVQVAQGVYEYSQNFSSSLESATKTQNNLDEAQKNYQTIKAKYGEKLEYLSYLKEKIKEAEENYLIAAEEAEKALQKIEEERQLYDKLFEQWVTLKSDTSFKTLLSLNDDLEKNELNDTDFKQLILDYYDFYQTAQNIKLTKEINEIRDIFENGRSYNTISGLPSYDELKELGIDLDDYDFSNAPNNLNVKIFSTSELNTLNNNLKNILASEEFDFVLLESIMGNIEILDKANYDNLNAELENYKNANEETKLQSLEKIKNLVSLTATRCKNELNQRNAILILLNGTAQEIKEFFSTNSGYEEIYEDYKNYSFALLNEKQNQARKSVLDVINNYSRDDLDEYLDELEKAGKELNSAGKNILNYYKNALFNEKNDSKTEAELMQNINAAFEEGNFTINEKNYHISIFESFFEEDAIAKYQTQTQFDLEEIEFDESYFDTSQERTEIISQMQDIYIKSLDVQGSLEKLNEQMAAKLEDIKNAQNVYNEKTEALRGDSENSAINLYITTCDSYNSALKETQEFYNQVENARREYRIAEEIYFYAENEYLHGNIDVYTPLLNAQKKLSEARIALNVIEELEKNIDSESTNLDFPKELKDYEKTAWQYYKSRILIYEHEQEVIAQKERLYQAQMEEQAAFNRLACEYKDSIDGISFQIPITTSDFINATRTMNSDGTYSYSFTINPVGNPRSPEEKAQSDEILMEYYTDECVKTKDIYGNEYSMSLAKQDAFSFIYNLTFKKYNIEDLALAFLYIKLQGNPLQRLLWLRDDEDPNVRANYPTGDIPESMHSVNMWDAYDDGRKIALSNAYQKVINNDGVEDLKNYILFSETNINPSLQLYQRQHDALSIRGLDNVVHKIEARVSMLRSLAAAQMAIITSLTIVVSLPFGIGAWAAVPLAVATVLYKALKGAADKLCEVKSDVREMQRGYELYSATYQISQFTYINSWQEAVAKRQAEEQRLNILLYGKTEANGKKVTWSEFERSIKECMDNKGSEPTYSYFGDLHNENSNNLKEFFNEIMSNNDFTTISDIINEMYLTLRKDDEEKKSALNEYIENEEQKKENASTEFYSLIEKGANGEYKEYEAKLKTAAEKAWNDKAVNKKQIYSELLSFYDKELLANLPVRFGNPTEDYIIEIFENMKELCLSNLEDNAIAQINTKKFYFSILENDLQNQYESWLEKINSATNIGIEEWKLADEKINAAYNSWQKEWIDEAAAKNSEWDENYTNFLQDKQNWINQSYLQANVQDFQTKNYAAVSKIETATNMFENISDYVSSLYDAEKFSRLADFTGRILSFADEENFGINHLAFDKADSSLLKDYDNVIARQTEIESDMKKAAAKYQAQQMQMQIEESIKNYFFTIQEKNEEIEDWELGLVLKSGYRVDSEIHRDAIVDSTAFETIREKQTVHRYNFFTTSAPEVSFDTNNYQGSSDYFIMKKVEEIQMKIQDWQEKIFGKIDENRKQKTEGELQKHIGESPTFIKNIDLEKSREANLQSPGSGEMGLIMLDFQWNSMKNSQGYAELSRAIYDQKLTTGSGWFQLPTLRDILSIICDIAGNSGMVWLKYIDDIVLGITDVGMGYKTFEEAANDAVKQGMISVASSAISSASSAIFSNVGKQIGKGAQIIAATQRATTALANNVASSYINAFDFTTGSINWEQANSVWGNASTFTSMAGTTLGGALGEMNNVDSYGNQLNANVFGSDIAKMNDTIGSLSSAAMNYAFTGDLSLNLASINGVGLFEVGIKDGKFGAGISENGTSFSLFNANLQQVIGDDGKIHLEFSMNDNIFQTFSKGTSDAKRVSDLKKGSLEDKSVKLNAANLLAWSGTNNNIELAQKLFNGEQKVSFAELDGDKTYSARESKTIVLDSQFLSNDKDKQAMIPSLIAYQNALNNSKNSAESGYTIDINKLLEEKKKDGTNRYTKEDIENLKNKPGYDAIITALTDTGAAFATAHDILGSKYDSIANTENLSSYADAYKKAGFTGIFTLFAERCTAEKKNEKNAELENNYGDMGGSAELRKSYADKVPPQYGKDVQQNYLTYSDMNTITFENVMRLDWYQNTNINREVLLGFALSKEEYTKLAKKNAAERYAEKKLSEAGLNKEESDLMKQKLIEEALEDEKILKDNGYVPKNKNEITLSGYGCTLSTATYIAYSITGKVVSLKEANEILKENNVFREAVDKNGNIIKDENGISEKTLIYAGDDYAKAVNAIARSNVLETDGKVWKEYSSSDSSKIFNRLKKQYESTNEVYYTHMRVFGKDGDHSVLFKSMTYGQLPGVPGNSVSINVYNPWKITGNRKYDYLGRTTFNLDEIKRADFYRLTEEGKKKYYEPRQTQTSTTH